MSKINPLEWKEFDKREDRRKTKKLKKRKRNTLKSLISGKLTMLVFISGIMFGGGDR